MNEETQQNSYRPPSIGKETIFQQALVELSETEHEFNRITDESLPEFATATAAMEASHTMLVAVIDAFVTQCIHNTHQRKASKEKVYKQPESSIETEPTHRMSIRYNLTFLEALLRFVDAELAPEGNGGTGPTPKQERWSNESLETLCDMIDLYHARRIHEVLDAKP